MTTLACPETLSADTSPVSTACVTASPTLLLAQTRVLKRLLRGLNVAQLPLDPL